MPPDLFTTSRPPWPPSEQTQGRCGPQLGRPSLPEQGAHYVQSPYLATHQDPAHSRQGCSQDAQATSGVKETHHSRPHTAKHIPGKEATGSGHRRPVTSLYVTEIKSHPGICMATHPSGHAGTQGGQFPKKRVPHGHTPSHVPDRNLPGPVPGTHHTQHRDHSSQPRTPAEPTCLLALKAPLATTHPPAHQAGNPVTSQALREARSGKTLETPQTGLENKDQARSDRVG